MEVIRRALPMMRDGIVPTLITREGGAPMRHITNGRRHKVVGSYYSMKNGKGVPWESRVELRAFFHAEVDHDVTGYRAQPHTLEMIREGKRWTYTPDREDRLADGRIEIVEIKDLHDPDSDPAYTTKLAMAQSVYEGLGWGFSIVERTAIEAEPRFAAVECIQCYRRTVVNMLDVMAMSNLFTTVRTITFGDICEVLGQSGLGLQKACAMVVRRIIAIDLGRGLHDDAHVRLLDRRTVGHG